MYRKRVAILLASTLIISSLGNVLGEETPAGGDIKVVSPFSTYESDTKFSISEETLAQGFRFGRTYGRLEIDGRFLMESEINGIPAYIVYPEDSIKVTYVPSNSILQDSDSEYPWEIVTSDIKKIDNISLGGKMKKGGVIVQKSIDGVEWDSPAYINTDIFSNPGGLGNFYVASRADINIGTYYRILIAYKTQRVVNQSKLLFLDTSSYDKFWNIEEYRFFLLSDDPIEEIPQQNNQIEDQSLILDAGYGGLTIGNVTTANRLAGEEAFQNTASPHGFAAEAGNIQDAWVKGLINGQHVEHTGSNNVKNGPDYIITQGDSTLFIQSKYYSTPSNSINACFDKETKLFRYYDGSGNPMQIEVPSDQYEKAVLAMQNKILEGAVPNVTDPADAEKIIRKGALSYNQAVNLAKAGTIESLKYDAVNGCVTATTALGISAIAQFALSMWETQDIELSLKNSVAKGLQVGGNAFAISVISSQLSRAGINSMLVPGTDAIVEAIGPKAAAVISNAGRSGLAPIYGAAAMKHAAKLLRGNIIASSVSLVVLTVPDVIKAINGRISVKQLAKNASVTAGSILGGVAGGAAGGVLIGSIIPGPGNAIGGVAGAIAGGLGAHIGADALADMIAEDDADEMLAIVSIECQNLTEEYLLNATESEEMVSKLEEALSYKTLETMYACQDRHGYARNLLIPMVETIATSREIIVMPTDDQISEELKNTLEEVYEQELLDEEV